MFKIQPVASNDHAAESGRNPIAAFDADLVDTVHVSGSADDLVSARREMDKAAQSASLLKAVRCIDLTTLSGDDTPERVKKLCAKARQPLRPEVQKTFGVSGITTAAVCVYHAFIETALEALAGTSIPVAAVSAGFPHGLSPFRARVMEVEASVAAGAREIDIVIDRSKALTGNWRGIYDEVRTFRESCGEAHLKAIIATGDLGTLTNVAKASLVCMMAGADFIKTSTGKEAVNATPEFATVMARMIGFWRKTTGYKVGFKAAGGIAKAEEALLYQTVMQDELGAEWLEPSLFRIGASRLLTEIEQHLET